MDRDWQNEVLGFSFADPWVLLVVPAIVLIWFWRMRRRGPALGFPDTSLLRALPQTLRARCASAPTHLFALGLVPVALALARPQELTRVPVRSEGIDILLCLDLSSSMAARDMERSGRRSRLDVVKDVAQRFVGGRTNDRIGLVSFALFPDVVCPATLDHEAVKRFLAPLQHKRTNGNDPEDRTGIGRALAMCVKRLEESEASSRVVILLTDGQENVGDIMPQEAAALAKDAGVRVYTIGAGRGVRDDLFGIVRKPDFGALREIAETTGGAFFEAESERSLDEIFTRIDAMERTELRDPIYLADELFFLFLGIGTALLFLSFLLRMTWLVEVP